MLFQNIFLLLGSNLGDRLTNLAQSATLIEAQLGKIRKESSIYETAPWGKSDQPNYLNQVMKIETVLKPDELLAACLTIEKQMGREREEKWGARLIDIDIIYFGQQIINSEALTIPHPRIAERRFLLTPLTEIAPNFVHPFLLKTNQTLLAECKDNLSIEFVTPPGPKA